MATPQVPLGWAFLVARGRRRGYRSILVPDFLAEAGAHGVLGEAVGGGPPPSEASVVRRVAVPAAGTISVAFRTRRVTHADLDAGRSPGDGAAARHAPTQPVTDEHDRPLEVLYGFVCRGEPILEVDEADLEAARVEALGAYRRFLADEARFTVELSEPHVLRSVTAAPELRVPAAVPSTRGRPRAPPPPLPATAAGGRALRLRAIGAVLLVLAVVAVSAVVWLRILLPETPEVDVEEEPVLSTMDGTGPPVVDRAV